MSTHVSKLIKQGRELDAALADFRNSKEPGLVSQMADALEEAQKLIIALRSDSVELALKRLYEAFREERTT